MLSAPRKINSQGHPFCEPVSKPEALRLKSTGDATGLHVESQTKPFGYFEVFRQSDIYARLERTDKNIPARRAETGFVNIANAGRIARRHSILPGL
jgi:hypothetical protein